MASHKTMCIDANMAPINNCFEALSVSQVVAPFRCCETCSSTRPRCPNPLGPLQELESWCTSPSAAERFLSLQIERGGFLETMTQSHILWVLACLPCRPRCQASHNTQLTKCIAQAKTARSMTTEPHIHCPTGLSTLESLGPICAFFARHDNHKVAAC